ncbi:MAG TPA: 7-cyano-7-deazaguanine synthase, partial [Terriglobales bacterium]|nr:7-cyano-7-deazaguanine synthase [Terriglobales bacterium]
LSAAVSWAEVLEAERVIIGAVAPDSSGYPDCRPEYYDAFNALLKVGTKAGRVRVEAPLIHMTKAAIVRLGLELGAPFPLSWSCYQNSALACGRCDSCRLRKGAFREAGASDPIAYAAGEDT